MAAGLHGLSAAEPMKFETDPEQKLDVAYRLFKTQNMWTQLLLDTRDGRVWQVAFTIDKDKFRGKIPITSAPLVTPPGKVGRFTLYPTQNMWTFLVLDTEEGGVWQCQFSIEEEGRFVIPILTPEQGALTEAFLGIFTDSEQKTLQDPTVPNDKKQELMQRAIARLIACLTDAEQKELQNQALTQTRRQELMEKALRTLKEQKK
jgi:hypothetical protein